MADTPRTMGRLGSTYGIKGYLKVVSFTEQAKNLFDYSPWYVRRRGDEWREVFIEAFEPLGDGFIVKLQGVDVREDAKAFCGQEIGIRRSSLPDTKDGEFYLCDLEGCKVIGLLDVELGIVSRIMDQGAAPILVVSPSDPTLGKKEILIPFVRGPIISEVDLKAQIIRAEWGADY